jgi:ubiquinone/menaquinone biosynthesis C-methylase UbiE
MTPLQRSPSGPEFFVDLVVGYRAAKIVFAANDLGLFEALREGPLTYQEVASRLRLDGRGALLMLRALVALGVCEFADDRFANSEFGREYLVRGRPRYVGDNLRFQELIWPCWSSLQQTVRSGRPERSLGELLSQQDNTFTRAYIGGMHDIARAPAAEVARILSERPMQTMLDVGGGPGTYSMCLLDQNSDLSATIFDLPTTLRVTSETAVRYVEGGRLSLAPGDYLSDRFPAGPFDLVLISHVTHDESPATNLELLRKARDVLRPGGRVAIHDFVVSRDGTSPLFGALFSVNMLAYTRGGQTYSREEYADMLATSGFGAIATHEILEGRVGNPSTLVVGERG